MSRLASLLFLLLASVVLAGAARAAEPAPETHALTIEAGDFEDALADEWEEEELEEEGEEAAEEWEAWEEGGEPPLACILRSASAKATLSPDGDLLRVTVAYTTHAATPAAVEIKLRGTKGSLRLPTSQQKLGRRGTLRIAEPLAEGEERRARAAFEVGVRFRIGAAPSECAPVLSRHLTVRSGGAQLTWRQSDSIFGAA